jgi:hypothetical protein
LKHRENGVSKRRKLGMRIAKEIHAENAIHGDNQGHDDHCVHDRKERRRDGVHDSPLCPKPPEEPEYPERPEQAQHAEARHGLQGEPEDADYHYDCVEYVPACSHVCMCVCLYGMGRLSMYVLDKRLCIGFLYASVCRGKSILSCV